jgi:peptidylprolyl isomerase
LEFEVGSGHVIRGFDEGVVGMEPGEKKTIHIPAADAYGPSIPENVIEFPRTQFPPDMAPEVGMELNLRSQDGQNIPVVVADVKDEIVVLDANHPLAGRDLVFDVEVVEIS